MTKIMLVEDDNNLREIYEARLLAEGYEIVSAKDGEEALALTVKEKPDLIISDVMMPKISGFDMLDILRSTPEIKNTKVIMMTALSQAEDKSRADKLGADRYLVKSQVTLEDVARVTHEVLTGEKNTDELSFTETPPISSPPAAPTGTDNTAAPPPSLPQPPASSPTEPPAATPPVSLPAAPASPVPVATLTPAPDPLPPSKPDDDISSPASDPSPLDSMTPAPETAASPATPASDEIIAQSTASESAAVDEQIKDFVAAPSPAGAADNTATTTAPLASVPDETDALNLPDSTQTPSAMPDDAAASPQIAVQTPPPADADNGSAADVPKPVAAEETKPQKTAASAKSPAKSESGSVPVAHKKVISPLSSADNPGSNLDDLLVKEEEKNASEPAAASLPPATSVIQPGGATVTPVSPNAPANPSQPGNVVRPAGGDPGSIAL